MFYHSSILSSFFGGCHSKFHGLYFPAFVALMFFYDLWYTLSMVLRAIYLIEFATPFYILKSSRPFVEALQSFLGKGLNLLGGGGRG